MALLKTVFLAAATIFAVASANSYKQCYNEGERCIGARGKPAVPYLGCCGDMTCSAKDTSYGGYGLVCAKKGYPPAPEAPKCYKEGERCIGAPGKPAVPYLGCCDGMECSAKDTSYGGYGLVCAKKGYPPAPKAPKCYKEGERCIGAPGKPAVPYLGCCGDMTCSAKDTSYGGYGFVCAKKGYPPVPEEPKCLKKGSQCQKGYGPKCCGKNACIRGYGKYEYECGVAATTAPPTTTTEAPKCIADGKQCSKDYGPSCCGYSKCVRGYGQYAYVCGSDATTAPPTTTTTAPKCIADGEQCSKDYGPSCCGYSKCVRSYGQYAFVCGSDATTAPPTTTTTTAKCIAAGEKCGAGYTDKCCTDTECRHIRKYGYEPRCVTKDEY